MGMGEKKKQTTRDLINSDKFVKSRRYKEMRNTTGILRLEKKRNALCGVHGEGHEAPEFGNGLLKMKRRLSKPLESKKEKREERRIMGKRERKNRIKMRKNGKVRE